MQSHCFPDPIGQVSTRSTYSLRFCDKAHVCTQRSTASNSRGAQIIPAPATPRHIAGDHVPLKARLHKPRGAQKDNSRWEPKSGTQEERKPCSNKTTAGSGCGGTRGVPVSCWQGHSLWGLVGVPPCVPIVLARLWGLATGRIHIVHIVCIYNCN